MSASSLARSDHTSPPSVLTKTPPNSPSYEGLFGGVFVSTDGGLVWSLRANEEALIGRNLHSLAASPQSTVVFGASEDGILKSADAGKTWSAVPVPRPVWKKGQNAANTR